VLVGAAVAGEACALVLLLREGLAAWIERRTAGAAAASFIAPRERPVGAPHAAGDQHASLVHVLASMAISNRGEESRR